MTRFFAKLSVLARSPQRWASVFSVLAQPQAWQWVGAVVGGGAIALSAVPALALQMTVNPSTPKLGETISVVLQYDNPGTNPPPTVSYRNQSYPSFPVGPNRYRALLPTTPLDTTGYLTIHAKGAGESASQRILIKARSFPTQSIWLPPGTATRISDAEYNRVQAFKQLVTPTKYWRGPFVRPNGGPVTSIYGLRRYYNGVFAKDYYHRGVDYAGRAGSPVVAAAAGKVRLVGYERQGFTINGNIVGIDHGQGVTSAYLHLSQVYVKEGDMVQAGQLIGRVGASGISTGPHLHWGLYVHGQAVDPVPWRDRGFE